MSCQVGSDIDVAARSLREGGVVAFPTETVYGLGARAVDVSAVAHVFEAKDRPSFDPLIVHVSAIDEVDRWTTGLTPQAHKLAERFWPGPLTLVLRKSDAIPDLVTSGLPTVAIRVPRQRLALQLIRAVDAPLAAPSANLFGQVSPTTARHVYEQLGEKIDYILDGGPCQVGIESTVIDLSTSTPRLLRPGGVCLEEIESILGPVEYLPPSSSGHALPSPGLLDRHYAPRTPLQIVTELPPHPPADCGLLTLTPVQDMGRFACVEVLSTSGDLREAAAGFYAALRRLDDRQLGLIVVTPFPDRGLGMALNDRLRRAAVPAVF